MPDNDVIKYFKQIDENFDGKICKQEIIDAFDQAGIDIQKEIEAIMSNLDNDQNGYIEFTELSVVLTDWSREISRKTLAKLFEVKNNKIPFESLQNELCEISAEDWAEFKSSVKMVKNEVQVESLKEYIKSQLE